MASSGNFCTLNPLTEYDSRMNRGNYSNGNLTYDDVGGDGWIANMAMTVKTYCEFRVDSLGGYGGVIGLRGMQAQGQVHDSVVFQASYQSGKLYHYTGETSQSVSIANIGGTVSAGDIVMFAYDPATYKWWVGVDGTWRNSGDPANGTGFIFQGSSTMFENMDITWGGWSGDVNRLDHTWNWGQDSTFNGNETAGGNADENGFGDFAYAPPTGFLALCTGNMAVSDDIDPAQTSDNYPSKNFNAVLYTGDGSTSNAISNLGFSPDLVWIKQRSSPDSAYSNSLVDTVRGRSKVIYSQRNNAEATSTSTQDLVSFDSDGFTVGTNNQTASNGSSKEYVAWCWKAGGTASSDDSGDITVSRSTNSASKFTIATWTGNGSSGSTIAHGLGVKPAMTFIKKLNATAAIGVWHQGFNDGDYDSFGELLSDTSWYSNQGVNGHFSAAPGTDFLTLTAYGQVNTSSDSYVGYFWANVEGMQKFSHYVGNGNADGPYIYTGFRPRLLVVKRTSSSGGWRVYDTARHTFNPNDAIVRWNDDGYEDTANQPIDFLSNGFKIRSSNQYLNESGGDFIYMAWADVPTKYGNTF
jgi:hypothetical protein